MWQTEMKCKWLLTCLTSKKAADLIVLGPLVMVPPSEICLHVMPLSCYIIVRTVSVLRVPNHASVHINTFLLPNVVTTAFAVYEIEVGIFVAKCSGYAVRVGRVLARACGKLPPVVGEPQASLGVVPTLVPWSVHPVTPTPVPSLALPRTLS